MEETPPRRSRPKPPSGGSSLPFIPIFIGVIVLGFVIGAGLSVVGKHGSDVAVQATSSPSPSPAPSPMATFRYKIPAALPAVAHKPKASPKPAATETPAPSAAATTAAPAEPSPADTQTQTTTQATTPAPPSPTATPVAKATSAPVAVAVATHRPPPPPPLIASTHVATAVPASTALIASATVAPSSNATTAFDADGDFSRLAGNVVRQYLLSIARGDSDSAYAALGQGPGSHSGALPEVGTVDSTMHISKIEARGSDSSATVNVDLTTAAGPYYGQYTVHKSSTGAAIIVSHTFGKP